MSLSPSPQPGLSPELLARVSRAIGSRMGLHYPVRRFRDLERGLRAACGEFGFADYRACAQWLAEAELTPEHVRRLAAHFTTGETYFFRETKTLEMLEQRVLPGLIARRRNGSCVLRLWSAGCCTGEEAYTLAILLFRMLPAVREWNVTILATDINEQYLARARAGVYREWSFRNTPAWLKRDFFRNREGEYEILPHIRDMVRFQTLNLATDPYPACATNTASMDLILCRNVLIYFDAALMHEVVRRFKASLVPDGWLATSPTEAAVVMDMNLLAPVHGSDALLFRNGPVGPACLPPQVFALPDGPPRPADVPCAAAASAHGGFSDPARCDLPEAARPGTPASDEAGLEAIPSPEEAQAAFAVGDYRAALAIASARAGAARPAPEDRGMPALAARCLANLGRLGEAREWCGKALACDGLDPLLHYLMATILQEEGDAAGACDSLGKALYLDQGFIMAHFTLGSLARGAGGKGWRRHLENGLALVRGLDQDAEVPHSGGLSARRLAEVMQAMLSA